jgi:hypothetical protein
MHTRQTTVTDSADLVPDIERRRFLTSLIIATAGALVTRTAAADTQDASSATATDWQGVLTTMFPHDSIEPSLYMVPAGALAAASEKDPGARRLLDDGWRLLQQATGGDWHGATNEARTRAISSIVGTPVFALLRQTTVFTFYGNPKVWEAFGYEGDAWSFGGYVGKGLNTIDWLPDPPPAQGT